MNFVQVLSAILLAIFQISSVAALRFEVPALSQGLPQCVREFVTDGQLVVVTVNTDGRVGDGQILSIRITGADGNEYRRKDDVAGSFKVAFTAKSSSSFDICFENKIQPGFRSNGLDLKRQVEMEVEAGSAARDWNAIQAAEKLKPAEVELRKTDDMIDDIYSELQYLVRREERLRDTNESTNRRVKNFGILIIVVLVSVGLYQIRYMRNYFRSKHIL
ncbi:DEKNAAC101888 [Brettanomyces naardenensis]|uniref:DEKNAAC101888 n=1 Tax=Brettanomyces naardenensis TaxID=13370 RepID=A0A448YJ53_BRENA|nr:DEKNAAC101888 [Brettanomyces naardenensis]